MVGQKWPTEQGNNIYDKVNDEGLPLSVTFKKDALVPLHHHFISVFLLTTLNHSLHILKTTTKHKEIPLNI